MRTELIEAVIFVSIHAEVTVHLLVLLEVVDQLSNDLVTYSCDVQLKPITSKAAMRSCVPLFVAELAED